MSKRKSHIHLIMFILILLLTLGVNLWAASAEDERVTKLIEGAKKEKSLVWYTIMDVAEATVMAKKFEEKYPFIKTELVRLNVPRLLARILAETGAKAYKVDVLSTQGFPFWVMKKKGLFQKYMSPQSAFYPEGAKDPDGYGTSVYLTTKTLGYHTKLVPPQDVPKTYEALLDPKWKGGKLCVDTDIYEWFGNMLKIMGREKGLDLMKKIALQRPQVRTGNTLRATLPVYGAGEFSIAIAVNADGLERMKAKGAAIGWTYPEPIVTLQHMAGVLNQAPHPNAAKLFVDFMLAKEGQEIIRDVRRIPTRPDVDAVPPISVRGMKLYYSDHSIADIYNEVTREYDEIFVKK